MVGWSWKHLRGNSPATRTAQNCFWTTRGRASGTWTNYSTAASDITHFPGQAQAHSSMLNSTESSRQLSGGPTLSSLTQARMQQLLLSASLPQSSQVISQLESCTSPSKDNHKTVATIVCYPPPATSTRPVDEKAMATLPVHTRLVSIPLGLLYF